MKSKPDPRTWTKSEVSEYLSKFEDDKKIIPCGECLLYYTSSQAAKRHRWAHRMGTLQCESKGCEFKANTVQEINVHSMFCCMLNEKRIDVSDLMKSKKSRTSVDSTKK